MFINLYLVSRIVSQVFALPAAPSLFSLSRPYPLEGLRHPFAATTHPSPLILIEAFWSTDRFIAARPVQSSWISLTSVFDWLPLSDALMMLLEVCEYICRMHRVSRASSDSRIKFFFFLSLSHPPEEKNHYSKWYSFFFIILLLASYSFEIYFPDIHIRNIVSNILLFESWYQSVASRNFCRDFFYVKVFLLFFNRLSWKTLICIMICLQLFNY